MAAPESHRYAVLGNPVAHSRSPFIHEAFARECGLPIRYERVLSPLDGFETTLRAFAHAGGRGVNVTVPFKFEALALARGRSARAALAGAANVLKLDGTRGDDGDDGAHGAHGEHGEHGAWWADNTDGVGLVRDIQQGAGIVLAGHRVLLLGAGGAAAGALGPLIEARPAQVVIANRSVARAQTLLASHAAWADQHGVALRAASLAQAGTAFDVIVNATSSSLAGAPVPVPPEVLARGALALDMMYGAAAEPFLRWATAAGAVPRDGLGMLVEQAAEAFVVFRGIRPATAPVLAALREVIAAEASRS